MFEPFKNNHQSMQVGDLVIENQTDKIIVYGDIDIAKSKLGLEQAKTLQKLFSDVVNELSKENDTTLSSYKDGITQTKGVSEAKDADKGGEQTQVQDNDVVKIIKNPFT